MLHSCTGSCVNGQRQNPWQITGQNTSIVKSTVGLRVDKEEELRGLDISEHGMEAYPDFRTNEG